MLANYLIGLREGLEASLVVAILVTYLVRSGRTRLLPRIWVGVGVAVVVSLAFGAALTYGPKGLTFEAQEAIGGGLSIVAVGFVTWMVMWMAKAARTLSGELRGKVDAAADGGRLALVIVAMLAVGREGLETALFLWAATQQATAATGSSTIPLVGAGLGIATAVVLGYLFYRGALTINLGKFFQVTGAFLIVVAGGVLGYGIHDLQEARILPGLNTYAWDISATLDPNGVLGTLLKGIFNFSPATTVLEAVVWVLYVVPVMWWFFRRTRTTSATATRHQPSRSPETAAV